MLSKNDTSKAQKPDSKKNLKHIGPIKVDPIKPVGTNPVLKLKLKVSTPKLNVMIACCGMLRDHEVFRQINESIVKQFGELLIEGVLLLPDKIGSVPDTPVTRKAIEDGILILMPGYMPG